MAGSTTQLEKSAAKDGTPLRMKYRNSDVSLDEAVERIIANNTKFDIPNVDLLVGAVESTKWN